MSNPVEIPAEALHRILTARTLALRIALGGLVGSLVIAGLFEGTGQFLRSYLASFVWVFAFGLGSLVLLMIQNISGGVWGYATRRLLEAAAWTLPALSVHFLPILLGFTGAYDLVKEKHLISKPHVEDEHTFESPRLYEWAVPDAKVQNDKIIKAKSGYLNIPFWLIRSAIAFALWIGMAWLLISLSDKQDREKDPEKLILIKKRMKAISAPGILVFALTILFISTDWVMSLEPHWYSTMYPVIFGFSMLLSSLALSIIGQVLIYDVKPLDKAMTRNHLRDLGSFMLGFVVFWTYISFSQFLLMWSANLKEEVPYYIARTTGGWEIVTTVLCVGHFFMPFLLLLFRETKRRKEIIWKIAAFILFMRFVDIFWQVGGAFHHGHLSIHLLDFSTLALLGGAWAWVYLGNISKRPLLPLHDEREDKLPIYGV